MSKPEVFTLLRSGSIYFALTFFKFYLDIVACFLYILGQGYGVGEITHIKILLAGVFNTSFWRFK